MSQSFYQRNLDKLYSNYPCDTPRNAVLDILFSDQQSVSSVGGGESVLTLSAVGGEFFLSDDRLIDATIILLFRDGLSYYETTNPFTMMDKEFSFDAATGTITFPPAPFPPLQPFEKVTASYVASGAVVNITEPVTLAQAKAWLRVTHDEEDDIISALITAARQICEGFTGKSFVERTVTACLRNDLGNIKVPYGPVGNITFAYDAAGSELQASDWTLTGVSDKRLVDPVAYVKIVYTAGFAVLPQHYRTGLKMQLSWMYSHRGDEDISLIAPDAKAILSPFRAII